MSQNEPHSEHLFSIFPLIPLKSGMCDFKLLSVLPNIMTNPHDSYNGVNNRLVHVALTGLPSSGKTEIAKLMADSSDFLHISNDQIREDVLGSLPPFSQSEHSWSVLFKEFAARKHTCLASGRNVVTDNCPFTDDLRAMTMMVDPDYAAYWDETGTRFERYLVLLDVSMDEILRRNAERGRTDEQSMEYMKWMSGAWEHPDHYVDIHGEVPVLRYPNNTPEERDRLLIHLGKEIGYDLL